MRSIGLDVHKHFAEVAISEPGRGVRPGERIAATPAELRAFAETLGPDDQVVLEATVNTWQIADLLRVHAGRVVVSNPMKTRAIAEAKVKTDKVDAAVLGQLLAADFIPEVWVPDEATRALRRQVAHRASLVSQRTALRNRIHGVLHRNLLVAPGTDIFGKAGRRWLEAAPLPIDELDQVRSALRLIDAVDLEVEEVEKSLARHALQDEGVRRLMTIPGVGLTTAVALVAVIGDVKRFPRPNQLVGYLGLDPKVRQSGGRPAYTGHISLWGFRSPIVFENTGRTGRQRVPDHGTVELSAAVRKPGRDVPGGPVAVPRGCPEEAVRPLLGELSGTGEDDRDLGISHRQPCQHVGEPGAPTRLSPKQVGVLALDNHGGAPSFRQPLHLEGQAAVR